MAGSIYVLACLEGGVGPMEIQGIFSTVEGALGGKLVPTSVILEMPLDQDCSDERTFRALVPGGEWSTVTA